MEGKYDYRPQGPFPPSTLNYFHGFLASTPVLVQPFSAQQSARPCKSGQVSSWLETLQWSFTQSRCSQVLYELCPIPLCHPRLPFTLRHARVPDSPSHSATLGSLLCQYARCARFTLVSSHITLYSLFIQLIHSQCAFLGHPILNHSTALLPLPSCFTFSGST